MFENYPQEEVEIKFKFSIPEHKERLHNVMHSEDFEDSLREISDSCRTVLKYLEEPSDDLVDFAEEIMQRAGEHLAW